MKASLQRDYIVRQQWTGDFVRAVQGQLNPRGAGNAGYDPVVQKIGSAEEVFVHRDGEPVVRQGTHWPPLDENGADTGEVRRDRR